MDITDSWARSLRAAGRSQRTILAYIGDADYFTLHLAGEEPDRARTTPLHDFCNELRRDHPLEDATRGDVEAFMVWCRDRGLADATVARRYRSLQQLYRWLDEEGEVDVSPMARMKPPRVVDTMPPIIPDAVMEKLLASCRGELADGGQRRRNNTGTRLVEFEVRRDTAIVTMLRWSGVRSDEIMGMTVDALNLDAGVFTVIGKGSRLRNVALVAESADAADRYLRVRARHPSAKLSALWVGRKGAMTNSGLAQMLERRCADAGIEPINPHRFRHTFAHMAKVRGMTDEDLMQVAGWQSLQMLGRYGRAASAERAQASHRKLFG